MDRWKPNQAFLHGDPWSKEKDNLLKHQAVIELPQGVTLTHADVAADGGSFVLAGDDGVVRVYDPHTLWEWHKLATKKGQKVSAVRLSDDAPVSRDALIDHLVENQIGTSIHFKPVHRFRYYREGRGLTDADFPVASSYADRTVSLPFHQGMSDDDVDDVAAAMRGVLE